MLTDSYPGLDFDASGVCSLCRSSPPPDSPIGEEALLRKIAPYRETGGNYDCIVAYSGGRDSSYILWHAVRRLGLKTLAVFTDNGFAPEHTHGNIRRAADILGIEVHVERYSTLRRVFPGTLRAWMRKPSAATVSLFCTGCSYGRRMRLPMTAQKHRIPLMLVGGGEPERSFAEMLLVRNGQEPSRWNFIKGIAGEMGSNPRLVASPVRILISALEFAARYTERSLLRMMRIRYPETKVFPYRYIGWNERTIMETIRRELEWETGDMCGTAWRSDCLIAPLKNYIYGRMLGFHKVDELLSGMVRMGQIGRDEALDRLEGESRVNPEYLDSFLGRYGTSLEELDDAISSAGTGKAL